MKGHASRGSGGVVNSASLETRAKGNSLNFFHRAKLAVRESVESGGQDGEKRRRLVKGSRFFGRCAEGGQVRGKYKKSQKGKRAKRVKIKETGICSRNRVSGEVWGRKN